jgi:hypothetical protein
MSPRVLLLLSAAAVSLAAAADTSSWVGAEYTPAAAPGNGLWWHTPWFESYLPSVRRELAFAARRLNMTTVRMALAPAVWEADGAALLANMDTVLGIAAEIGIKAGFIFFDDDWNQLGASLQTQCTPIKGRHNGCWLTSPQFDQRENITRYKPYVTSVITRFAADPRVLWWEVFNEPDLSLNYSVALRDAGYAWAVAASPTAPVISCWSDNVDTQIVDIHDYDTSFVATGSLVYSNPAKGALITEAGSRWYQPPFSGDYGSVLTYVNFLTALQLAKAAGQRPYVPGAMISWELMVGNSNTRWHWNSPDGANEPAIPWDAWLFPDGTPISHTEAAALRRYMSGRDEFLSFSKFLPTPPSVVDGDAFLTIPAGSSWTAPLAPGVSTLGDVLVEASVWLEAGGAVDVVLRAGTAPAPLLPATVTRAAAGGVGKQRHGPKSQQTDSTVRLPTPPANCTAGPHMNDTDVCSGGPVGYRDMSVAGVADPFGACAAACCAWDSCTAWVVRHLDGTDANCTNELCCWLKPGCSDTSPFPGATSGIISKKQPPLPAFVDGYHTIVDAGSNELRVLRVQSGQQLLLGVFNCSTLDNGIVLGAWNMLRILLTTATDGSGAVDLSVFFNPMFGETGFVGDASDAYRLPLPLPPRLALQDAAALPPGGLLLAAGGGDANVDYVSALPPNVF